MSRVATDADLPAAASPSSTAVSIDRTCAGEARVTGLAARLARLQAQAGCPAQTASNTERPFAAPPSGLTTTEVASAAELTRLRTLLGRRPGVANATISRAGSGFSRDVAASPARHSTTLPLDRDLPGTRLAPGLRYVERQIRCELPPAEFLPDMKQPEPVRAGQLLCFDTETTGLAGGSGTRAFMIGAADWHDGSLRLRQLYLDAMAGEPAMLDAFASWLDPDRVLVSYNGRSYDAPLLATRYRLARRGNPLTGLQHVDLLHPVRRRYRGCWQNCRLATVERELLQVVREDDLPGAMAPAAWLGWLRGGPAEPLRQVLRHNAQDLVSLARLLCVMHPSTPELPPSRSAAG